MVSMKIFNRLSVPFDRYVLLNSSILVMVRDDFKL
jgi:hypothetical protein